LDKIGDRFFRAKNTGQIDGTGLGLAIVQKILNTYGGAKNIVSTPGKGTKVTISLPA
jgi:signal transduction histidine kinase